MHPFSYPEQLDHEDGAAYWERVRQMGLPYPWEQDKTTPPGPITVGKEWSTRDPEGEGQLAEDEQQARERLDRRPGHTLHYRWVWRAVGDWQDAPTGSTP